MKRRIFAALALLTALALLGGCGGTKKGGEDIPVAGTVENIAPEEFCNIYYGTWTAADGAFITFDVDNYVPKFLSAVWDAGIGRGAGEVEKVTKDGDGNYDVTVHFPAQEENEMNEAYEEETVGFTLADSKEVPNSVFVTFADGSSKVYTNDPERQYYLATPDESGGQGEQGTNGASGGVSDPEWAKLEGYWTAPDGGDFVNFITENGQKKILFGVWNAGGGRGAGEVTSFEQTSDVIYALSIHFPRVEATEMEGPYEEQTITARVIIETQASSEALSVIVDAWQMDELFYRGSNGNA